ncbi:Cytochrome c oxidase assembly protein cox19 [Coemansia javaensis]|uniref:Cytochrome c oxidase assembly protein cox19 n=1 Tax=Coemansia javaensis TaxID=2761396 RepID=A0A9W8HCU6_9FUNG|nr:Cytochrome c oxidase assembly protein cox19 [Coemansia javaensis]
MSFGGPPKVTIKPEPPIRGSFPLDHGGECKEAMVRYLECLESKRGSGKKCRGLSKEYLECRMQRRLMDRDKWENLGFHDAKEARPGGAA